MLSHVSSVHRIAAWVLLAGAVACGQDESLDATGGSSGAAATAGATGGSSGDLPTTGGPGSTGSSGSTGPGSTEPGSTGTGSTEPTGGTTAALTSSEATTGSLDGSETAAGGSTETSAGETTTDGGSEDEGSSGSTGVDIPLCGEPLVDFKCFGKGDDELLAKAETDAVVPANTTQDIPVDISECGGDPTRRAYGLVVDVALQDACLWSMELSIVCPSGEALALTTPNMCGPCAQVAAYHAVFRQSFEPDCTECDFNNMQCIMAPVGGDVCPFLAGCQFDSGEPWALRVKAGATPVTIPSVALHLAF